MAVSIKSWVVRKKRTVRRKSKSYFDSLPEDLQIEILIRLDLKNTSKATCVSHTWRDIILSTTLPSEPQPELVTARLFPYPFLNLEQLFQWCSRVMHCRVSPQKLIDTCNGLLLFCHKDGEARNLTRGVYYYYVMNHVTKQCVAVLKQPRGTDSGGYSYASLAYDPSESWFFKIMRFHGCRHVSVFSSENGCWETLTLDLPKEVNESHWVRKCVYTKGAIYRLSWSGHLIKFMVDPQETIEEQAVALPLPPACVLNGCHWDIGVRHGGNLLFVMSLGAYLFIFEHMECCVDQSGGGGGGGISYEWRKICSINDRNLRDLNSYGELLSYHPYHGVVFFKRRNILFLYLVDRNNDRGPKVVRYETLLYDYIQNCGLPLLECSINFACTLDKQHPRDFQRLRVRQWY